MQGLKALREQVRIQCSPGNWDFDPYMHGMANGLICALATIEGEEPVYLNAPPTWLSNKLSKGDLFLKHIQEHLKPGKQAICKICGKTSDEIANKNFQPTSG